MVKMTVEYLGNLNIKSTHEPSKSILKTAAPIDNNGDGSSFSPTDLLANATLNCMITIMGISANTHNYSIEGTTGSVEKHMEANPRRVGKLVININVPQNLSEKETELVWASARNCPVMNSLSSDLEIDLNITFIKKTFELRAM